MTDEKRPDSPRSGPNTPPSKPSPDGGEGKKPGRRRRRGRRKPAGAEGAPKEENKSAEGAPRRRRRPPQDQKDSKDHKERGGSKEQKDSGRSAPRGQGEAKQEGDRPPRRRRRPRRRAGGKAGSEKPEPRRQARADEQPQQAAPTAAPAPPPDLQGGLSFPDEDDWGFSETKQPSRRRSGRRGARRPRGEATSGQEQEQNQEPEGAPLEPTGPSLLDFVPAERDPDAEDEYLDLAEEIPEPSGTLADVVLVRQEYSPKQIPFLAGQHQVKRGDQVVVEADQGMTIGEISHPCRRARCSEAPRRVIRVVDPNDLRQQQRNQTRESEAFSFCQERIHSRKLPMKLIRVSYVHGGNRATFYFSAEHRIDFRELVKDLAQRFHTRIVMRQVGVRDESRMTGGLGSCGCELCCATWLPKFEPVSIRMAKDQGLVLNPQKVSGQCGRLKCCLTYEEKQYQESRKSLPKPGRRVQTPLGNGKVQELDVLRRLVRVYHEDGTIQTFPADQVKSPAAQTNESTE